jgi:hypothetical protein
MLTNLQNHRSQCGRNAFTENLEKLAELGAPVGIFFGPRGFILAPLWHPVGRSRHHFRALGQCWRPTGIPLAALGGTNGDLSKVGYRPWAHWGRFSELAARPDVAKV